MTSERRPRWEQLVVFAAGSLYPASIVALAMGLGHVSALGAYFDGHLYIEIARSFPLPYAPEARGYLGQAPGFPAQLWLARWLTLRSVDWGTLATVSTWLSAGAAAVVFHAICRDLRLTAGPATACFVLANPSWALVAATSHPEPLAMTFALLCLRAHLRGAVVASMLWLALATLTRFPVILVGGALAIDLVFARGERNPRRLAWLAAPLAALLLQTLYLRLRIPGFEGIWAAHDSHWHADLTWPFAAFLEVAAEPARWGRYAHHPITFASLAVYLGTFGWGLLRGGSLRIVLPLWIGSLVGFHVSLTGRPGVDGFMRLVVLAWPAAVLLLWLPLTTPARRIAGLGASLLAGALAFWYATSHIPEAVRMQRGLPWMAPALERLEADEPGWIDFDRAWRRRGSATRRGPRPGGAAPGGPRPAQSPIPSGTPGT